jgi:hypothetical protein
MNNIYTGIGSRETPEPILSIMESIGFNFGSLGWLLRSGGASGADSAFEKGATKTFSPKEIYLPWKLFNNNLSKLFNITNEALSIAAKFHKNWSNLSHGSRLLHARNVYQVLGYDLKTPTKFIICWTVDGKFTGGTGQALRIADHYNIPIYNLFKLKISSDFVSYLLELYSNTEVD